MSPMKGLERARGRDAQTSRTATPTYAGCTSSLGGMEVNGSTIVITSWLVRHGNEIGIVFLNDYALGDLHGGVEGFRAQLQAQGFNGIRLLGTLEELDAAEQQVTAAWSGPWLSEYPWETPGTPADRWQSDAWQNVSRFVAKRFQLVAARKRS